MSSVFKGKAYFWDSTFNGNVKFIISEFNDAAEFIDSEFNEEASFNDAVFKGDTSFNSSHFKEDALFWNTTFVGKLSLSRTRYKKLYIRWHDINSSLVYDDAAYMSLLKNFQELGYFLDYDSCYSQYVKENGSQI